MGDRRAGRTSQARERGQPAASEELGVEHSVEEKSLELGLGGLAHHAGELPFHPGSSSEPRKGFLKKPSKENSRTRGLTGWV